MQSLHTPGARTCGSLIGVQAAIRPADERGSGARRASVVFGQPVGAGPMVFHDRKLVFFDGPSNVVVELAEWLD
jgi:hypothetical protein